MKKESLIVGVGVNDLREPTQEFYRYVDANGKSRVKVTWTCPIYRKWYSMLNRCYSKKYQQDKPTYEICTVCEEWLLFSNFKSWMQTKYWDGLELDKDILIQGNTVYSPDTCVFVPRWINSWAKSNEPQMSYEKDSKRYKAYICVDGKSKNLGRFKTREEAISRFKLARAEIIKNVLDRYEKEDYYEPRVKEALLARYSTQND